MIGSPAELDQAGLAYLARLTDADLRALVHADQVSAAEADGRIGALRREPALILDVLDRPATSAAVLNLADRRTGARPDRFALISPFLIFAAAIHRTAGDLSASAYAPERTAPRLRIPLFDAGQLSAYLGLPRHRLFLAELLASFAKISSGMVPIPGRPGRRRWSDADPARLAVLLDTVPAAQRPPVWRRLGDLALFLAGVFPDAAERVIAGQAAASRLARRTGLDPDAAPDGGAADLLEWLGSGWYRLAAGQAGPADAAAAELRERAEQFRPARRVLTTAADRYLLPLDSGWLTAPG
ncbi:MAG TPA: hypothetical protein VFX25_18980 [Streptosporangiaceae bacterium]|jgi:hypothetical protein|nr:hypothetical protein [Streptosporangiaceae bacterium]